MKVLIKDLAHYNKLNPDQLVAFAHRHRNLYGVFDDDTDDPIETAKTSTWHSNELVKDFKHANRKGHDWRDDLPENNEKKMKKVRESLNEQDDMQRIADASYRRIYKEVKDYCKTVIKECGDVLDQYEEEGAQDEEDDYTIANNEGRIEIAQNIMEILRNL